MNSRKLIKTIGMAALIGTIAIGMAGCGKSSQSSVSSGAPGATKIGFIVALSGGAAAYGLGQQEGTLLAVEEINAKSDFKIDLETMDTKGSTQQAISAAQKLINSKSAIVIGPTLSGGNEISRPDPAESKDADLRDGGHCRRDHGYRGLHFQKCQSGIGEHSADGEEDAQAPRLSELRHPVFE